MKQLISICLCATLLLSCKNRETVTSDNTTMPPATDSVARPRSNENSINPYASVDLSPMDMSYFPVDYPKLKIATGTPLAPPLARVIYSRPHLQGRHIFHEVLKYGEPWRMGANEATELQLFRPATIQGKTIPAGRYILYCIPQPHEWTIALNQNTDTWGLQQDASKDVARFTISVEQKEQSLEYYTMVFEPATGGAILVMAWDNVELRLPLHFN